MRKRRLEIPTEASNISILRQAAAVFVEFGCSSIYVAYTVVVTREVIRYIPFSLTSKSPKNHSI